MLRNVALLLSLLNAVALCSAAFGSTNHVEAVRQKRIAQLVDLYAPRLLQLRLLSGRADAASTKAIGTGTLVRIDKPSSKATGQEERGEAASSACWVITADHLLAPQTAPQSPVKGIATWHDGSQASATLVGRDLPRRLALWRVESSGNTTTLAPLQSAAEIEPAASVLLMGRAFTAARPNLTFGIVSAVDRLSGRAIQVDAAASATNYGGPAFTLEGSWLGVVAPLAPSGQQGEDWYDSGIGFVVPAEQIEKRLARLASGETIYPGWLGSQFVDGNPMITPAQINNAVGPAAEAGLQKEDLVIRLNAKPTPTIHRLRIELGRYDAGDRVAVAYRRGQVVRETIVTLGRQPVSEEATEDESQQ